MDFEASANKLEKERKRRQEEAQKKLKRETELQKAQAEREVAQRKLAEQRRIEFEAAEAIRLENEAVEAQRTGGVKFEVKLEPYEIDGDDDKIILPEEYLMQLINQGASDHGAMIFCLSGSGNITHCGIREFTAPPGKIGIPPKVINSIVRESKSNLPPAISVKYVRLPKCTYAKLQPRHNKFFDIVEVKVCLENSLQKHVTLTVGDIVTVWYRGSAYELCVVALKPDPQCMLINADVEIDLDFSEEFLQQQRLEEEARKLQQPTAAPPSTISAPVSVGRTLGAASSARASPALSDTDKGQLQSLYNGVLDSEPDKAEQDCIQIKFKTPSGATLMRRFATASSAMQLFYYVGMQLLLRQEELRSIQLQTATQPKHIYEISEQDGAEGVQRHAVSAQKSMRDVGLTRNCVLIVNLS